MGPIQRFSLGRSAGWGATVMRSRGAFHPYWTDRTAAGLELAEQLGAWTHQGDTTTVVALPRGGVPVAVEIARRLDLPLTTWAVRKLALPTNPEFAIGAIAPGDVVLWDPASSRGLMHYPDLRRTILEREEQELRRRQQLFGDAPPEQLRGRQLIVVDDGIATGLTVRAALLSLRQLQPQCLVLAVPVVASRVLQDLRGLVNEAVVLAAVDDLIAVGCHYFRFEQLRDADVLTLLAACRRHQPVASTSV
jgi:putative phosphoribosyl transferase